MSLPRVELINEGGYTVVFSLLESPSAQGNRALASALARWDREQHGSGPTIKTIVPLQTPEGVSDLIVTTR